MCFCFGSKPKPQDMASKNQTRGPAHIGGANIGVWPVQPLPPEPSYDQGICCQNHVREKKYDDNLGKKSPSKWDYSENGKERKPKKSSACDQKFTTSEATARVNQSPTSTPEKYMMNSCEEKWNMTEYTKPTKTSSDEKRDKKSEGTKHADYLQQKTVDSDSETRRTARGRNCNEEEE